MSVHSVDKRPLILSMIIVCAMIGCFFSLMASIMPGVKKTGEIYPALLGAVVAMRFIALSGVWHMKRWGVHFYVYAILFRIMLYILMGDFGMLGAAHMFFSILYTIIFLFQYKRMDKNL